MNINKDIIYYFLIATGVMFLGVIFYSEYQYRQDTKLEIIPAEQQTINIKNVEKNTTEITIFLYNKAKDIDPTGNILCDEKSLVPSKRLIPKTNRPIQDSLVELIEVGPNQNDISLGLSSEFPLESVKLKSINLKPDGTLLIDIDDPKHRTVGGSCRTSLLYKQILLTAKQFEQVKSIEFLDPELLQP